jgi:hypothetical protein
MNGNNLKVIDDYKDIDIPYEKENVFYKGNIIIHKSILKFLKE